MRNYIQRIFNKTFEELKLQDVELFFESEQEETAILEFKRGDSEINDLLREITAFHNTEGGLLIVGAPNESRKLKGKDEIRFCQGTLTSSRFGNKERLLQKIGSNIVPYPTGLMIKEFRLDEGSVFLIDVPQSVHPPHQCGPDGRYYIRVDNESKPATHGFVQAMFNQRRVPILRTRLEIDPRHVATEIRVIITFENHSIIPAENVNYLITFRDAYSVNSNFDFVTSEFEGVRRYSYAGVVPNIVVRKITTTVKFSAHMLRTKLHITVGLWSRTNDIQLDVFTYDSVSGEVSSTMIKDDQDIDYDAFDRGDLVDPPDDDDDDYTTS